MMYVYNQIPSDPLCCCSSLATIVMMMMKKKKKMYFHDDNYFRVMEATRPLLNVIMTVLS